MSDGYSIVVAGHGSRDPAGRAEFEALVDAMAGLVGWAPPTLQNAGVCSISHAYLEFATPTVDDALRSAVAAGARKVVLLPSLLLAAGHAKNDMPSELAVLKQEHPEVEFHYAGVAELHPLLLRLCQRRLVEAEATAGQTVARADTLLVVVGRGTSDPDANSEVYKLARLLEEGMGYGGSYTCYSGTAKPLVMDGLLATAKLGFNRIVVFPLFLFDGVLVKRIYQAADALAARYPDLEVLKAGYLGPTEELAELFLERAREAVEGRAAMNCGLCQYRVQIVGFENKVGQPQMAHHGHVKGLLDQAPQPEAPPVFEPYVPHPIEAESFRIIESERDWSAYPLGEKIVRQRLVHTSGDLDCGEDLFFSPGAVEAGLRALLRCRRVSADVTMVQSGLRRDLLARLGIETWCGVHDPESHMLAQAEGITRSAAGIRRAWQRWGNDQVVAIGDAPTAVMEAVRLIREHGWRPQLVVGLPVGFVGTRECKEALRRCMQVPRITNAGTRGGSPWAASAVNAIMICAINQLAGVWEL